MCCCKQNSHVEGIGQVSRLVYIVNARLPTEKAHGYQICKMCEAFAQNGVEVVLMHPDRHQLDPALRRLSVFDYYGVPPVFDVRTLRNLDVVLLERFFPSGTFMPVFFTHAVLWGLYAARVARREKADLYYTRDITIAYWLVQLGLPTVYEAHVVPKRGQQWLLQRIVQKKALHVVVLLASFMRERFIGMGCPLDKIIVLLHGVDLTLFESLPSKEKCRQRLGLPLYHPIVGYIGRFYSVGMEKGVADIVRAMSYIKGVNGYEPLLLSVGGPIEMVPEYLELARQCGVHKHRLHFVDRVPNFEVLHWIRACDTVVLPLGLKYAQRGGTMPLKLFEYMASQVPIVATDLPSIREVLRHGQNSWTVEPGDSKALAEGSQLVFERPDLARRLAKQSRRDVAQYTWEERVKKVMTFCERRASG